MLYNIITVPLHVAFSSFVTEREKQTGSSVVLTIDAALNVIYLCDLVVSARMGELPSERAHGGFDTADAR